MVMSTPPPSGFPGGPPRGGPRDAGDAWVVTQSGEKYWGRFGAAGLLAVDAQRGVLLQHRAAWSHYGGTWGLPGGARHQGESAVSAALREAAEEAGVLPESIRPRLLSVHDVGEWSYSTVVSDVIEPFDPVISDPESLELVWVSVADVDGLALHPGFAAAWPRLRGLLSIQPTVIVDVANVMGSVPDGWWRDRVGAAGRLLERVAGLAERGVVAAELGLPEDRWFPNWVGVVEGKANAVALEPAAVSIRRAQASGDDAIVAQARDRVAAGEQVTVVSSDRALGDRVRDAGGAVVGTRWLLDQFEGDARVGGE